MPGRMSVRGWLHDLSDKFGEWYKWLDKVMSRLVFCHSFGEHLMFMRRYQTWCYVLSLHLLLMTIIFVLVYGWISACSWWSAKEPRHRRPRSRREEAASASASAGARREEAASAGARRKRKTRREVTPPPQRTTSNPAALKSSRVEEKRTGKKQPNVRERRPCGRPLPASHIPQVARPAIKPETHLSAPTGTRTRDPLMHRMALHRRDDSEDLETFYIWVKPNEQVAEVSDMQSSRFPQSETATQPLEMDKKNEGWKKPTSNAKTEQNCMFHGGNVPWWVRLDEGALKQRKPHKM